MFDDDEGMSEGEYMDDGPEVEVGRCPICHEPYSECDCGAGDDFSGM